MPDPSEIAAFRFGFGLPQARPAATTPEAILAALSGPDQGMALWPGPSEDEILSLHHEALIARRAVRKSGNDKVLREAYNGLARQVDRQEAQHARLFFARALDSPDAFRERLSWFWSDHFTTMAKSRQDRGFPGGMTDHALRPHLAGRFSALLRAAVLHPAMLLYLDQSTSMGPGSPAGKRRKTGLNENLARELVELHTLGVGADYAQEDVRQLAELLTGVAFEPGVGQVFHPRQAEPGPETVLGTRYEGEGMAPVLAALDDLARRPDTARHLARKLAVHFLTDTPDEQLVERMAEAYLRHDTALLPVYEVMLTDASAFAEPRVKARQPGEFLVASLRALNLGGAQVMRMAPKPFQRLLRDPLAAMGQPWARPRGPDGWPEAAAAWISPQGLAARISWAMEVPGLLVEGGMPDPRALLDQCLGGLAGEPLRIAAARSESIREGVGLVLASPEFNRR
ncbi:DUF1800 domain-containing protein [Gemmobacter fulvus]|uniref:DUF1800 domain-containing protein n=1 Tax=Gemmobacter fulvus TaxID=2840474 RepID=UPI0027969DBE|nr:DUF1800 domain-containing protein [Gemmobacter fulvus]MDQ1849538.1 DUF1800 domain-containing protein [Gemmobacter fulvus]